MQMLKNFVYDICGCKGTWKMDDFAKTTIEEMRKKIGNGKVLCALSGGVDSSVAAVLLSKAVGKQLTCVFVDHGLLRKNEGDEVEAVFGPNGPYNLNFVRVNAQERFYAKLKGVTEPERKRKIINELLCDNVPVSDWYPVVTPIFGEDKNNYPNTYCIEQKILNFPLLIDDYEIQRICECINRVLEKEK